MDTLSDNLAKLALLPTATYEDFASDFRNIDSALHRMQTSIQALADIAAYVVGCLGLRTPTSTLDVIHVLGESGLIDEARVATYARLVQFRNRVVHLYNRIDPRILYRIITEELGDIREFQDRLLTIIQEHPDS